MGQRDGLRLLHMRIARHDRMQVFPGNVQQRVQQVFQHDLRLPAGRLGIHPRIQRHLIVAAPAGMQALPCFPDPLRQQGFHVHVDILRVHHPLNPAGPGILQDPLQTFHDLLRIFRRDDSLLAQHGRMSDGTCDVLLVQALVKRDAGMEVIHQSVRSLAETASPKLHALFPPSGTVTNIVHKTRLFATGNDAFLLFCSP